MFAHQTEKYYPYTKSHTLIHTFASHKHFTQHPKTLRVGFELVSASANEKIPSSLSSSSRGGYCSSTKQKVKNVCWQKYLQVHQIQDSAVSAFTTEEGLRIVIFNLLLFSSNPSGKYYSVPLSMNSIFMQKGHKAHLEKHNGGYKEKDLSDHFI